MFAPGFQSYAFQYNAANNNSPSGVKKDSFSFVYPYQRLLTEGEQLEKIKQVKISILKSEIEINDLNKKLAEESMLKKIEQAEGLNAELRSLLATLLAEKSVLVRRLQNEEAILLLLIASKKRRLRAV